MRPEAEPAKLRIGEFAQQLFGGNLGIERLGFSFPHQGQAHGAKARDIGKVIFLGRWQAAGFPAFMIAFNRVGVFFDVFGPAFVHFIGTYRFHGGVYRRMSMDAIKRLGAVSARQQRAAIA